MTLSNETLEKARLVALMLDAINAKPQTTETLTDLMVGRSKLGPMQLRLVVAGLLMSERIDMKANGELFVRAESPELPVQFYHGAWYVVLKEGVKGPFSLEREAVNVCTSIRAQRLQAVGSKER